MARKTRKPDIGIVVRRDTLADQAYANLRRALMSGRLSPGEKLTVRGIASALSVSLTPAREAIGRLVSERALDVGANRTVTVPVVDAEEYKDLLDIRLMLEGRAAEEAAPHFGRREVARLEDVHQRMVAAIDADESKLALSLNEEFHFLIYRASNRPMLVSMIEGLWLRVGPLMNLLTPRYQRSYQGAKNHSSAIEAARTGDAAGLRRAIEKDLGDGAQRMLELLNEQDTARADITTRETTA